jgi:hypothetical protein
VYDRPYAVQTRRHHNRDCNEAAFRENDVGFNAAHKPHRFTKTLHHAENVRNVFYVQVTPHLSGGNTVEGDAHRHYGRAVEFSFAADIIDFITSLLQFGNQCETGHDMPRRPSAR